MVQGPSVISAQVFVNMVFVIFLYWAQVFYHIVGAYVFPWFANEFLLLNSASLFIVSVVAEDRVAGCIAAKTVVDASVLLQRVSLQTALLQIGPLQGALLRTVSFHRVLHRELAQRGLLMVWPVPVRSGAPRRGAQILGVIPRSQHAGSIACAFISRPIVVVVAMVLILTDFIRYPLTPTKRGSSDVSPSIVGYQRINVLSLLGIHGNAFESSECCVRAARAVYSSSRAGMETPGESRTRPIVFGIFLQSCSKHILLNSRIRSNVGIQLCSRFVRCGRTPCRWPLWMCCLLFSGIICSVDLFHKCERVASMQFVAQQSHIHLQTLNIKQYMFYNCHAIMAPT